MSSTASPTTTRTSPMSGIFTPPSSCSSHWTYEGQAANSVTGGLLMQNANAGQNDRLCYPPGFEGWGRAPSFVQVFSPGACPSGYTTANNNYDGQKTTAVCCLSNFGYTNFLSSVNAGGKTAQYYGCISTFTGSGVTTVFAAEDNDDNITSSLDGIDGEFTTVSGLITMWAQPITVAYQQNDVSLFTTSQFSTSSASSTSTIGSSSASSTTSSSSVSAKPASTISTAAPITNSSTQPTSSRTTKSSTSSSSSTSSASSVTDVTQSSIGTPALASGPPITSPAQMQNLSPDPSVGAIAGIVVGAVALLALITGASLFFRRQQRPTPSSRHLDLEEIQMTQEGRAAATKPGYTLRDSSWDSKRPAELQDGGVVELPNYRSSRRHELP